MKILKAKSEKHLDAILAIQGKCYESDMVESASVFKSIIDVGESFIFTSDDTIIGYALCHYWHDLDKPPKLHEELDTVKQHACFFIHDLAIDPSYRGHGFASTFVDFVRDMVDVPVSLVSVNSTSSFWERFGFRPVACDNKILQSFSGHAVYMLLL